MQDAPKPSIAAPQPVSSARALQRVADALRVPVSSFGVVDADAGPTNGPNGPEEAAVLAIVQSYLKRADPEERDRFVAKIQIISKLYSA